MLLQQETKDKLFDTCELNERGGFERWIIIVNKRIYEEVLKNVSLKIAIFEGLGSLLEFRPRKIEIVLVHSVEAYEK